jgi:hypothetical protein
MCTYPLENEMLYKRFAKAKILYFEKIEKVA